MALIYNLHLIWVLGLLNRASRVFPMNPQQQLLTVSQVARRLQLSSERVRQLDKQGLLKPDQLTSLGRLYLPSTVERFVETRRAAPMPAASPDEPAT